MPDFSFVWKNAKRDENNCAKYIMSNEDIYLHSVAHMYKHYVLGGFGVRFLADTYLMLQKCELDFDYISSRLDEMKLVDFEKTVRELSVSVMENGELDGEQIDFMVNVVSFGLYGDGSHGKELLYESFKEKSGSDSVAKYTLSRLFPDKEYMHRTYRVLDRAPFLLPYFYVQRLITKTFSDGGKAAREIKQINEIKKKDN